MIACSRLMPSSSSVMSVVGLRPISVSDAVRSKAMPSKPPFLITRRAGWRSSDMPLPIGGAFRSLEWGGEPRLEPTVPQRRQARADAVLLGDVAVGPDHARPIGRDSEQDAPGVRDQCTAVAGALRGVLPPLRGSDHEALVLDRARAEQDLPVVAARLAGERARHEQEAGALRALRAVQLGE